MSQTSIIFNVQQKLDDILAIQNVIVQNQHDMYDKLKDIEFRLVSVESRIPRSAQQMPSTSTAKSGLLHPQMGSQRMSLMPLWQSMRVKRGQEQQGESEEAGGAKELEAAEKRVSKRARGDDDEPEEGEVNVDEGKETEPGASSRADEELDEDSEADYDDDSTESSSTANISYSQKSTPPLTVHRSSMPHSILQSLATSSLLSSLHPQRHADLTLLATDENTGTVYLDEADIRRIFATSKSRGNFSALLVQKLYTKDERVVSNVMGTRGKRQLSPNRMSAVRRLSFSLYPVGDEREEETVWKKECVKAIDSKNRKVRTHHSVKSEGGSVPPGGIPSAPSTGPPARPSPRLLGNRPPFAIGLPSSQSHSSSSANAFAIAMAAAAAAAVASSNPDNQSPKPDNPSSEH